MNHTHPMRPAFLLLCAFVGLTLSMSAAADETPAAKPAHLLDDQTWSDPIYGVRLRPPADAVLLPDQDLRWVAQWRSPNGMSFRVAIHRSDEEVTLRALHRATMGEISFSDQEVQLDGKERYGIVAERAGVVAAYHLANSANRPAAGQPWVWETTLGLAMVQMDMRTVLVIEATGPAALHTQLRSTLMQMLDHLQLDDPAVVSRRIQQMVSEGHIWRLSITPEQRKAELAEPRLMRVLREGKDVGFMRIDLLPEDEAQALGNSGTAIRVQAFEQTPKGRIDRIATYFESDSRVEEAWAIRSTFRPDPAKADAQGVTAMASGPSTWSETAVRSNRTASGQVHRPIHDHIAPASFNRLFVTREGAPPRNVLAYVQRNPLGRTTIAGDRARQEGDRTQGINPRQLAPADRDAAPAGEVSRQGWPTPPQAYLSQIDLWTTLMFNAPTKQAERLAFYAYDPTLADVSLHLLEVQPQADSTSKVIVKASLASPPTVYHYDALGKLLRVELPGNVTWVPATPGDLQARWAGRRTFRP